MSLNPLRLDRSRVILMRTYESRGEGLPSGAIGVLVFLTLLSAYVGVLFAINIYGE
jgi:hypothetical protein